MCLFDLLYLLPEHEKVNDTTIAHLRIQLGQLLACVEPIFADIIVPIPETSIIIGQGYSLQSGIPIVNAVSKKRPKIKTLFINDRERTISDIFFIIPELIHGQEVVIIDETIISGTSLRIVIDKIRSANPSRIHIRVVAPPMCRKCPYRDFPDWNFIDYETILPFFNADSFYHIPIENLESNVNCAYCFGGKDAES